MKPYSLRSYPRAIVHVDGDSFFAACEVAKNPSLKGKPVVTGFERGIATAMTYEAKALGIHRGMRITDIRKYYPAATILPSDYETYTLYSRRMYDIMRRYTPDVEEYSIDECFGDITGMRKVHGMSYEKIAEKIKHDLETELGLSFSVGLGPTKVLAKTASKWAKPSGLTFIPAKKAHEYLAKLSVSKIWGIGPQTSALLSKYSIKTAYDFTAKSESWILQFLSKPCVETWYELRGTQVFKVDSEAKRTAQSIARTRTFTPASKDRAFVFSQLSKNIEHACTKARRFGLAASRIYFFLKTQAFTYHGLEVKLAQPVNTPEEILEAIREPFDKVYKAGIQYRATGITLSRLVDSSAAQLDLFGRSTELEKAQTIHSYIDSLSEKFGKRIVILASSLDATNDPYERKAIPSLLFKGETEDRRLGLPMLGEAR